MKGKRRLLERLTAFLIAFAMIAGMVMEPVSVSALPEELVTAQSAAQQDEPQQTQPEAAPPVDNGETTTPEVVPPVNTGKEEEVEPPTPAVTEVMISGRVICNSIPVPDVSVSLGENTVLTDINGNYSYKVGVNQNYEITFQKEGFINKKIAVTAAEKDVAVGDTIINLAEITLDKSVVNVSVDASEAVTVLNPVSYAAYEWQSGDANIASVAGGTISGLNKGETTVKVIMRTDYGEKYAEVPVKVETAVSGLKVWVAGYDPNQKVSVGETINIIAAVEHGAGSVEFFIGNTYEQEKSIGSANIENGKAAISCKLDAGGINSIKAKFTPVSTENYTSEEASCNIDVLRKNKQITFGNLEYDETGTGRLKQKDVIYGDESFLVELTADSQTDGEYTIQVANGGTECLGTGSFNEGKAVVDILKASQGNVVELVITRNETRLLNKCEVILPVKIAKRVIELDGESVVEATKVYDKSFTIDTDVFHDAEQGYEINIKKIKFKNTVQKDTIEIQGLIGTIPESVKDAQEDAYETKLSVKSGNIVLDSKSTINYEIDYGESDKLEVSARVKINRRNIKLKVGNATRQYGRKSEDGRINAEVVQAEGMSQTEGLLKGESVVFPETLDRSEVTAGIGIHKVIDIIRPEDKKASGNGDPGKNYKFDYTSVELGNLQIVSESIKQDEIDKYIDFKSTISADGKQWIKAEGVSLIVSVTNKKRIFYNQVLLKGINGKAVENVNLSDDKGFVFDEMPGGCEIQVNSLTLSLIDGNRPKETESETFEVSVYRDGNAPKVEIGNVQEGATPIDTLTGSITFGNFGKTHYVVKTSIDVKDNGVFEPGNEVPGSGLEKWEYTIVQVKEDIKNKDELKALVPGSVDAWTPLDNNSKTQEIPITKGEKGIEEDIAQNFIVMIRCYDKVHNSKIYTSRGIILDNNVPDISMAVNTQLDAGCSVYKEDVEMQVSVSELTNAAKNDGTVSGIQRIYYQIGNSKEEMEKDRPHELYDFRKDKYSLSELQKRSDYTESVVNFVIDSKKFNTNNVHVRATVIDNAGNAMPTPITKLMIDTKKPVVDINYSSGAQPQNQYYYNKHRTAVVTIKERNLDTNIRENVYFDLQREGEETPAVYSLNELTQLPGISLEEITDTQADVQEEIRTDDRTTTIKIRFEGDNDYIFDAHCTDFAGWKDINGESKKQRFVIDTTPPKMKVSYYVEGKNIDVSLSEAKRIYKNKSITAKVEIDEHNFALEGKEVQIDVGITAMDIQGKEQSIPDYKGQEKQNDSSVWDQNVDKHTSTYVFDVDANYTQNVVYTDLAGNTDNYGTGYFTVDKTQPEGSITTGELGTWERFLESITFGLFKSGTVDVIHTGTDKTSPIRQIEHYRFPQPKSLNELKAFNGWNMAAANNPGYVTYSVSTDEQFIAYSKVTDYAENVYYLSSDGVIVDTTAPAPKITVTNLSEAQNGIFNEDVSLQIDVEDPTSGETYAGLERVWYTVRATGNSSESEETSLMDNRNNKVQSHKTFSQIITISRDTYNSNDVQVQVFATDFAGNKAESEITQLKIDKSNPEISVSWDLTNPLNGRYYKDSRTATISVRERNFDPNNVRFTITNTDGAAASIGDWSIDSAGVSDDALNTCQVSFPSDGDYTFTFGCTDLAGNSAEYGQTDEFTIDKTVPVITVSYDNNNAKNGNYYKEARTATVSIKEHNFNASEVKTAITASLLGQGITSPSVSGFSNSGDVHTAAIKYEADGDYTFDVDYTDLAGNAAADYTQESFTVDRTVPDVEIFDVKDKSANNDVVAPGVKYSDNNYDKKSVSIKIEGANNGSVDIGKVASAITNGESIKLNDFPREEKMDDLYKLTAKVTDKAGNATEKSILFSVNRYGSVYVLDNDTKNWLSTDDEEYTYINQEKELGIKEYNVDDVDVSKITSNRDGELTNLKENTNYTVKRSGSEVQWKEYYYKLAADNFREEGNYTVTLYSEDKAKNSMNNESVKKAGKKLPLEFTVDKTAPTVVISGVEDGGQYRAANRSMTVDAKDNLFLKEVTVSIDGEKKTYRDEELRDLNGVIKTQINSANKWQDLEITAQDAAGNVLGQKKAGDKVQPMVLAVLVTPNVIVQYYMNKPLFFGSLGVLAALAAVIAVIVMRRKQQNR